MDSLQMRAGSIRSVQWMAVTATLMAMNVALNSFGVPVPGGHLYLNDIVICTAGILLDPLGAFLVGGVGAVFALIACFRFRLLRIFERSFLPRGGN